MSRCTIGGFRVCKYVMPVAEVRHPRLGRFVLQPTFGYVQRNLDLDSPANGFGFVGQAVEEAPCANTSSLRAAYT